jgi:hypothetical protein
MSFAEQKLAAKRKEYYQQSKKSSEPVASTVAGETSEKRDATKRKEYYQQSKKSSVPVASTVAGGTSEKRDAPVGVELAAKRPRVSENETPSTHHGSGGAGNHGKEASPANPTLCPSLASNITVIEIDDDDDEVIEIDDESPARKQTSSQTVIKGDGLPPPTQTSPPEATEGDIFM